MKMKKLTALLLALVLAGSLAACGSGGGNSGNTNAPQETMPNGDVLDKDQTLSSYLGSEPATLDSGKASDTYSNVVFVNCIEPLTRIEQKDGKDVLVAAGAEKWDVNEDGTVWTFHLRDNKWSDDKAVTAQDYAYGITRTLDPATGSPNSFFITCIKNGEKVNSGELGVDQLGVKAVDDKTLEITLENPTPYFLSLTYTRAMFPVRQDLVEKHGDAYGSEMDTMVFNGPFVMSTWNHNSEITLKKNESYWDSANVKLQTVKYPILNDQNAIYNSFDNKTFDVVGIADQEWKDRFAAKEDTTEIYYVNPAIRFDLYNTNDPLFANANIRKAFTLAINREELVKTIYQNTMSTSYAWVPEGVSVGDQGEFRAKYEAPLKKLVNENPDPKALLLKGMEELGLGTDPSTLNVKFSFGVTSQWMRNYGEYLQQIFKTQLGVNVELDYNEWAIFQSNVNSGNYQMGYMAWSIDYNDPMSMLALMVSGTNNIPTGWVNAEFDSLIQQAAVEMDEAKRAEMYNRAEEILLYEDAILCPVVNESTTRFVYNHVKNLPSSYFSDSVGGLKNVYISGRK